MAVACRFEKNNGSFSKTITIPHGIPIVGGWVAPTHLKNMRKSNWVKIFPRVRGENKQLFETTIKMYIYI